MIFNSIHLSHYSSIDHELTRMVDDLLIESHYSFCTVPFQPVHLKFILTAQLLCHTFWCSPFFNVSRGRNHLMCRWSLQAGRWRFSSFCTEHNKILYKMGNHTTWMHVQVWFNGFITLLLFTWCTQTNLRLACWSSGSPSVWRGRDSCGMEGGDVCRATVEQWNYLEHLYMRRDAAESHLIHVT